MSSYCLEKTIRQWPRTTLLKTSIASRHPANNGGSGAGGSETHGPEALEGPPHPGPAALGGGPDAQPQAQAFSLLCPGPGTCGLTCPLPAFLEFTKHRPVSGALHCSCLSPRFLPPEISATPCHLRPALKWRPSEWPSLPILVYKNSHHLSHLFLSVPYPNYHCPTGIIYQCIGCVFRQQQGSSMGGGGAKTVS